MIDVQGLTGDLGPDDFVFRAGSATPASNWVAAPAPLSITRRSGAGVNGSDRVTLVWRDGAIRDRWLEVTVKPTADTNLAAPYTFLFGSLVGETGDATRGGQWAVTASDLSRLRVLQRRPVTAASAVDFDRDGVVGARDASILRSSYHHGLLASPLAPAAMQAAAAPRPSEPPRPRRTAYDVLGA